MTTFLLSFLYQRKESISKTHVRRLFLSIHISFLAVTASSHKRQWNLCGTASSLCMNSSSFHEPQQETGFGSCSDINTEVHKRRLDFRDERGIPAVRLQMKRGLRVSLIQLMQSRQGFLNKYTRTANNNSGTTSIYFSDRKSELMQLGKEWEQEHETQGPTTAYARMRKVRRSRFTVHALREETPQLMASKMVMHVPCDHKYTQVKENR